MIHFLKIISMSHLGWSPSEFHTLVWEDSPPPPLPTACSPSVITYECSIFPVKFPSELVTFDAFPNAPRYSVLWATSFFWERSCEGAWPWLTEVFWNLNQPLWDIDTGSQRTWISEVPFVSLNLWKYLWSQENLRDSSLHKKSKQTHTYPSPFQKNTTRRGN